MEKSIEMVGVKSYMGKQDLDIEMSDYDKSE